MRVLTSGPKGRNRENGEEAIFKELLAKYFQELMKDREPHI